MPGYKVYVQENDGEVREGLKCFFCKLLLKDPVQSSETGQRYCKDCFSEVVAIRDSTTGLDPHEKAWPDCAVKKEIANLQVACENVKTGCEWKGSFKNLLEKHLLSCQYVTVECKNTECSEQVLLSDIDQHLKFHCLGRSVKCKDCGKKLPFKDLDAHGSDCPYVLKKCELCQQEMPAIKLNDHVMKECTWIKCPCSSGKDMLFEKTGEEYKAHLEDTTALASHLQPLMNHVFTMNQSLQAMTNAYQMVISKMSMLEEKSSTLERKNEELHQENVEMKKTMKGLTARLEASEKKCAEVAISESDSIMHANNDKISKLEMNYKRFESEMLTTKSLENKKYVQVEMFNREIQKLKSDLLSQPKFTGGELVPYNGANPMDYIRQVEEKTLEVERTLNILSVHHSELELQLQASLASTHNGAFLWRVPEIRRRIRDAKIGRITSIYSPPFYTGRNGYKMCIRAYLNGDGSGEGTHLSIFFVIMKGEYDPLLQWPFDHKVSLVLVDQDLKKHLVQTFKPNMQSNSFQKPKSDMNVASGCPEFAKLSVLDDPSYVKDDVMYIKAVVDTSSIMHP